MKFSYYQISLSAFAIAFKAKVDVTLPGRRWVQLVVLPLGLLLALSLSLILPLALSLALVTLVWQIIQAVRSPLAA